MRTEEEEEDGCAVRGVSIVIGGGMTEQALVGGG